MADNKITSMQDVVEKLILNHPGVRTTKWTPEDGIWYRGQSVKGWSLLPGACREDFRNNFRCDEQNEEERLDDERTLNDEFKRRAASLLPATDLLVPLYFAMQHHGFPTRLLDWTTNPLVGLFFAASDHPMEDGELFLLKPLKLPGYKLPGDRHARSIVPVPGDNPLVKNAIEHCFRGEAALREKIVIPVLPDLTAGRIFQQGSRFTLHMPYATVMKPTTRTKEYLHKYVIPSRFKMELVQCLRIMGINYATLFPGLDHLAREMKAKHLGG